MRAAGSAKTQARADDEDTQVHLDALFKSRYHGAANIRGIRYQILYSVLRGLELYDPAFEGVSVRLEGIEDLDLMGVHIGGEYIQAKYSEIPWTWSRLKEPIAGFLQELRADPNCHCTLVVSCELRGDIAKLSEKALLSPAHAARIQDKLRKLCESVGGTRQEADDLAAKLTVVSEPEDHIVRKLKGSVAQAFGLGSEAVETYISVLVSTFLGWAEERASVTRAALDQVRCEVGEALAREAEFRAYGLGLVDTIRWQPDEEPRDFIDGKATRPGHVAAGLDVPRPTWLQRIDAALMSSKICVLRSPSGQGKSTLMYQYAHHYWSQEATYALRTVESSEQVGLVANYIRFKASLGVPILLIVDNAGLRTRLWPLVAQECAALGVRVLVTTRTEDWYRFARENLTGWEVLEPTLDQAEAQELFHAILSRGQLHPSVDSAEWAYEKIGEPRLLMEYVYLLTHGRMLEERLRDQIAEFSEHGEDPAKVDIIRKAALGDALGVSLLADQLVANTPLRDDAQRVLGSLAGEYLTVEGGEVTGLHWVRSLHLARILHERYPNPAATALDLLDMVVAERIPALVANALCWEGCDADTLIDGLAQEARGSGIPTILQTVQGVFRAGCQKLLEANKDHFDEAHMLLGPVGPFFLAAAFAPVGDTDTLDLVAEVLDDEKGDVFRQLQAIAAKARKRDGGIDWARRFLTKVVDAVSSSQLLADIGQAGHLLAWCATCSIVLPAWQEARLVVPGLGDALQIPLADFCAFAYGLYGYDPEVYERWFAANKEDIIGYLMLNLDCIEVGISDGVASVVFVPDAEAGDAGHQGAMSRLSALRSALPFCSTFQSDGEWILPFRLHPTHDETSKSIDQGYLHDPFDLDKNAVWRTIVRDHYLPDSFYRYQEAWYHARKDALDLTQRLARALAAVLEGRSVHVGRVVYGDGLPVRLLEALQRAPEPPSQTGEPLRGSLKHATQEWSMSTQASVQQLFQYMHDRTDERSGYLCVYNMRQSTKQLTEMHQAFRDLFLVASDYFGAALLDDAEAATYVETGDLLQLWILDSPTTPQRNIRRFLRAKHRRERSEAIDRVRTAVIPLLEAGIDTLLPTDLYLDHPLRFFPLTFSVNNPCYPERDLSVVLDALSPVCDVADFFCLVPTFRGARIFEGGYQLRSDHLPEGDRDQSEVWESLVPHPLPADLWDLLPNLPLHTSPAMHLRANLAMVIGLVPMVAEYATVARRLSQAQNEWEQELHRRYVDRLRQAETSLADAAAEVAEHLAQTFHAAANESSYTTIERYLRSVESAAQDECVDETVLFDSQLRDTLDECVEDLVQRYL